MAHSTSTEAVLILATSIVTGLLALHSALALTTDKNTSSHPGIYTSSRSKVDAFSSRQAPSKNLPPLAPPVQYHAVSTTLPDGNDSGLPFVYQLEEVKSEADDLYEVVDKVQSKLVSGQKGAGSTAWAEIMDGASSDAALLSPALARMSLRRR